MLNGQKKGTADIFITPGFEFKLTKALLTNLHFPKDPILALTAAVGGFDRVMDAHRYAVLKNYRFGGYGDLSIFT